MKKFLELKQRKLFYLTDLIILAVVLTLVVLTIVFALQPKGESVSIYVENKLFAEKTLFEDTEIVVLDKLIVVIKDRQVSVRESNCEGGQCVAQSKIENAGQRIICLPQKIVIAISGKSDIDVVTKVGEYYVS